MRHRSMSMAIIALGAATGASKLAAQTTEPETRQKLLGMADKARVIAATAMPSTDAMLNQSTASPEFIPFSPVEIAGWEIGAAIIFGKFPGCNLNN